MSDTGAPETAGEVEQLPALRGGCLCGAVEFEVVAGSTFAFRSLCHCNLCQRIGGGVASAYVGIADEGMRVVGGPTSAANPKLGAYATSEGMTRFFCRTCSGPVLNVSNIPGMAFRDAPLSCFARDADGAVEHHALLAPRVHMFYGQPGGLATAAYAGDGLPKFATYPGAGPPLADGDAAVAPGAK
jgi:hypothetical protein